MARHKAPMRTTVIHTEADHTDVAPGTSMHIKDALDDHSISNAQKNAQLQGRLHFPYMKF